MCNEIFTGVAREFGDIYVVMRESGHSYSRQSLRYTDCLTIPRMHFDPTVEKATHCVTNKIPQDPGSEYKITGSCPKHKTNVGSSMEARLDQNILRVDGVCWVGVAGQQIPGSL